MEGMVTVKIIDNTVLTASLKEIKSIDLIKTCSKRYYLATSPSVYVESMNGFDSNTIQEYYGNNINVHNFKDDSLASDLLNYLERRYPYLHKGELTTFLIALLDYELKGKQYYYVTDDKKMRNSIPKILKDPLFIKKLGCSVQEVKYTGTIGLIKRLKLRGLITEEDINNIADELEQSTFRVSPELIEELRRC